MTETQAKSGGSGTSTTPVDGEPPRAAPRRPARGRRPRGGPRRRPVAAEVHPRSGHDPSAGRAARRQRGFVRPERRRGQRRRRSQATRPPAAPGDGHRPMHQGQGRSRRCLRRSAADQPVQPPSGQAARRAPAAAARPAPGRPGTPPGRARPGGPAAGRQRLRGRGRGPGNRGGPLGPLHGLVGGRPGPASRAAEPQADRPLVGHEVLVRRLRGALHRRRGGHVGALPGAGRDGRVARGQHEPHRPGQRQRRQPAPTAASGSPPGASSARRC